MKVFISWSGERSRSLAAALREWLPDVIQGVTPWMSSADIEAGARWNRRVQDELAASTFGIICVARENEAAPWLLFETGALAKSVDDALVVPYLLGFTPGELRAGPLTQFQAKSATREDTRALVRSINGAMKESALPVEKLDRSFERWWGDLEKAIAEIPEPEHALPRRTVEDMVEELLLTVRELRRETAAVEWETIRDMAIQTKPSRFSSMFSQADIEYARHMGINDPKVTDIRPAFVEAVIRGVLDRLRVEGAVDTTADTHGAPEREA